MIRFARERCITPAGSPERTTYELKWSPKTGVQELVEKGKEDWQGMIQSYAESCDLSVIIRRVNAGELDLLNARPGSYGDFTHAPGSIQEVMQATIDAKHTYDSLTDEQKKAFGSFDEFAATAGEKEWFERLGVKFNVEVKEEGAENADN